MTIYKSRKEEEVKQDTKGFHKNHFLAIPYIAITGIQSNSKNNSNPISIISHKLRVLDCFFQNDIQKMILISNCKTVIGNII